MSFLLMGTVELCFDSVIQRL